MNSCIKLIHLVEKKKKTCTGFELTTLALNFSTTQPPDELTVLFFCNILPCMYYMILLSKKMMSSKKLAEIITVPYHPPMQRHRKSIEDTSPGHCHISNFDSDFFLRERGFINPSPTRHPIAKNRGNSSPTSLNPTYTRWRVGWRNRVPK